MRETGCFAGLSARNFATHAADGPKAKDGRLEGVSDRVPAASMGGGTGRGRNTGSAKRNRGLKLTAAGDTVSRSGEQRASEAHRARALLSRRSVDELRQAIAGLGQTLEKNPHQHLVES